MEEKPLTSSRRGGEVRDKTFGKYGEMKEVQEEKEVRGCGARDKKYRWRGNRKESNSS